MSEARATPGRALAGVETGLWDLTAKRAGVPVCALLGGPQRPEPIDLPEQMLETKTGLYQHPRTRRAYWVMLVDGSLQVTSEPDAGGEVLEPLDGTRFQSADEAD